VKKYGVKKGNSDNSYTEIIRRPCTSTVALIPHATAGKHT